MLKLFEQLKEKWNNWTGDQEMEVSIRRHLSEQGYFGRTAKLRAVRLVAVQRPGWRQVFRFEVTARIDDSESAGDEPRPAVYEDLFGLVREDIRKKLSTTRLFHSEAERRSVFAEWSEGMICLRGSHGLRTGTNE